MIYSGDDVKEWRAFGDKIIGRLEKLCGEGNHPFCKKMGNIR